MNTEFEKKLEKLKEIIPFRFRVGSGVGKYEEKGGRKIYNKYQVMGYIDSRDCMDRLDEVFGHNWQRTHTDVAGKSYCEVSLWDGEKWVTRSDVGEQTAVAKNKGESSDAFKRACVNWGLGRFLYTMPVFYISADEANDNKYNLGEFIQQKYASKIKDWTNKHNIKLENSKYESSDDDKDDITEETPVELDNQYEIISKIQTVEELAEYRKANQGKGKEFNALISKRKLELGSSTTANSDQTNGIKSESE